MLLDKTLDEDEIRSDLYDINRDAQLMELYGTDPGVIVGRSLAAPNPNPVRKRLPASSSSTARRLSPPPPPLGSSGVRSAAAARAPSSPAPVRGPTSAGLSDVVPDLKKGELRVRGVVHAKGDSVVSVQHPPPDARGGAVNTDVTVTGVVTSINNSEVHLRLADGTKHRIYLSHLRNGRSTIERI